VSGSSSTATDIAAVATTTTPHCKSPLRRFSRSSSHFLTEVVALEDAKGQNCSSGSPCSVMDSSEFQEMTKELSSTKTRNATVVTRKKSPLLCVIAGRLAVLDSNRAETVHCRALCFGPIVDALFACRGFIATRKQHLRIRIIAPTSPIKKIIAPNHVLLKVVPTRFYSTNLTHRCRYIDLCPVSHTSKRGSPSMLMRYRPGTRSETIMDHQWTVAVAARYTHEETMVASKV
jgi:hypothetical protein